MQVEPADPEVDPPRVQRRDRAELLGHLQRRRDRQLHRAGADSDPRRRAASSATSTGVDDEATPRREVVLGHPESLVAGALRDLGEVDRVAQRIGRGAACRDRGEVEDRQWKRGTVMTPLPQVSSAGRASSGSRGTGPASGRLGTAARSAGATSDWNASSIARCRLAEMPSPSRCRCSTSWPSTCVVAQHLVDDLRRTADQGG